MITLVAAAAFGAVVGAFLVWLHWRLMNAHLHALLHVADLEVRVQSLTSDLATYEAHLQMAVDRHRAEHRRCNHLLDSLAKLRSMSAAVGNLAPGFNLAVLIDDMLRAAPPGAVPPSPKSQPAPITHEEEDHG
jgi:C4-dicarboxylate-specific signal transduction histidine kinase